MGSGQTFDISISSIIRVFVALLVIAFVFSVWQIIASVFLAVVIASGVEPAVKWLTKFKFPRFLAAITIYVVGLLIIVSVFSALLPALVTETRQLSVEFPALYKDFVQSVQDFWGLSIEDESTKKQLDNFLVQFQETLSKNASNIFAFTFNVFGGLLSFVLVIVISFYLVLQKDGIEDLLRSVIPQNHQEYAFDLWKRVQKRLGRWFQYQLLMGVSVGALFFIVLWVMNVKYALTLALLAALFEIVPVIGPIIVGLMSFVLVSFQSLMLGGGVLLAYVIIEQIQQQVLLPSVMARAVGLNPVIMIVALLVAGKLIGLWGVILAIPFAVMVSEFVKDFRR